MNRPLFAVLAVAFFAAGWGIDVWAEAGPEERKLARASGGTDRRKAPATLRLTPGGAAPGSRGAAAGASAGGGGSASMEALLSLVVPGRQFATRVQMDRAVAAMSAEELAEAAAALAATVDGASDTPYALQALYSVVERWLKADPAAAAEFVAKHERLLGHELHRQFIHAIAGVFQNDLETATRIMARLEGREFYIFARHECITEMKNKNLEPQAGLELIVKFDAQTRNQWHNAQTLGDYPDQWIKKDAPAAMNWALALTPGYSRSYILGRMADAWVEHDPAAAKAFLSGVPYDVLPSGNLRNELAHDLHAEDGGAPAKNNPPR